MTKDKTHSRSSGHDRPKAFIEHVKEARTRLAFIAVTILAGTGLGYAFHKKLLELIQAPLNDTLYYNSPVGELNFLIKLCVSVGCVIAIPVIFYNINRFLSPLISQSKSLSLIRYTVAASLLAIAGIVFAYLVSLPAALHFLTNFNTGNIQPLIGVNEYYNFALAYLFGYALLFQLPIIILIINKINPLKPSRMIRAQRWVILFSFIVAAILTPTPDPGNQLIMAAPAVVFYQVGILLVWLQNSFTKKDQIVPTIEQIEHSVEDYDHLVRHYIHKVFTEPIQTTTAKPKALKPMVQQTRSSKVFDIIPAR